MQQAFSITRIQQLIKREFILRKSTFVNAFAVSGVLLLIICLLSLRGNYTLTVSEFTGPFAALYIVVGIVLTFSMYKEAHNKQSNQFFFTLPVSALERFVGMWIATALLYTLAFVVLGLVVFGITVIAGSLMSGGSVEAFNFFGASLWKVIGFYLVIQPAFLYGAIRFTKNRLGKTILWISIVVFAFMMINMVFCLGFNTGLRDVFADEALGTSAFEQTTTDTAFIGKLIFGIALGPLMLIAGYFKLTEKQV